eukprot:12977638-Alexandrium_andersonii.AAC.1
MLRAGAAAGAGACRGDNGEGRRVSSGSPRFPSRSSSLLGPGVGSCGGWLSLIHISEPTRLALI